MRKNWIWALSLLLIGGMASCKSSQSAYRAAYEKAQEKKIEEAAPAPAGVKPIVINSAAAGKPLAASGPSATIKLKPVPTPGGAPAPAPGKTAQMPAAGITGNLASAMKGKTSRISLDEVLGTAPNAGTAPVGRLTGNLSQAAGEATPISKSATSKTSVPFLNKSEDQQPTLRLKRPAATAALNELTKDVPPPAAAEAPLDASEAPTVKRKSLVLKRNAGKPNAAAAPTLGAAGAPEGAAPGAPEGIEAPVTGMPNAQPLNMLKPEKCNVAFPIIAAAAAIAILGLVLLFMSQACGPDRTGTMFSSFRGLPSFDWPGKITYFN